MSSTNLMALHMQPVVPASAATMADAPGARRRHVLAAIRETRRLKRLPRRSELRCATASNSWVMHRPAPDWRLALGTFPGVVMEFTPYDRALATAPF